MEANANLLLKANVEKTQDLKEFVVKNQVEELKQYFQILFSQKFWELELPQLWNFFLKKELSTLFKNWKEKRKNSRIWKLKLIFFLIPFKHVSNSVTSKCPKPT